MAQKMKKDLFTILIPLMTLVFGAAIVACSSTPSAPSAPSLETTVDEIADLYAQNPASVQSKFKGKKVAVTGVFSSVGFTNHSIMVRITPIDQEREGQVWCFFANIDSNMKVIGALKKGEKVTIVGYGEANKDAFELQFNDCILRE